MRTKVAKMRRMDEQDFTETFMTVQTPYRVGRLRFLPSPLPPDCFLAYLGRDSSGRAIILMPVDKLNSVPKGFRHRVQGVAPFWEPRGEQMILVHTNGRIYLVLDT